MSKKNNTCPVCGYTGMLGPYESINDFPSFEICACCGTEFGTDDSDKTHKELRTQWILNGMSWWANYKNPPVGWDPKLQLIMAGLNEM